MRTRGNDSEAPGVDPIEEMVKCGAVLAPMSGITDIPFRAIAREYGCGFAFTEMIDVNGIVYRNRKSFKLMDRGDTETFLGVQLVGQDEKKIIYVAQICEEKGFDVLDINAGCPARKVIKGGKGAALMLHPAKLARIINGLTSRLRIPVTVKMRSGWNEQDKNCLEVARAVVGEGARAVCVHSRTMQQMYKGRPDREVIKRVKDNVDVPVFASGGIFSAADASEVMRCTGCDGVFVARGALGNPWIFRDIEREFSGDKGYPPKPSFPEIKDVIRRHFHMCVEYFGEYLAFKRMYKHMTWYFKKLKGLDGIMKKYRVLDDPDRFDDFIRRLYLDEGNRLCLEDETPVLRRDKCPNT